MKVVKVAKDIRASITINQLLSDVFEVLFHKIQGISFGCSLKDQKELLLFTELELIGGQVDCAGLINVE